MHRPFTRWRLPALSLPYVLSLSVAGAAQTGAAAPFAFHETEVLGTSMDLQVTAFKEADATKVRDAVLREVERLRRILSTRDAAADVSRVNASREPVRVSQELIDLLRLYEQWQTKTHGACTANLGEVIKLWQQAEKDGRVPDKAALAAAAADIQKPLWRIDATGQTVQRLGDQTINVDSLGKGFIVSRAAIDARAQVPAIRGLLLNIGGDITALGSSSTGGFVPWPVAVADPAHPQDNAPALTELRVSAASVATSGSYARGYQIAGKKYSHLLNPRTAAPVDFDPSTSAPLPLVVSATAIAPDNATANALAASLCVLPLNDGLALVRESEAECLVVLSDGTQRRSPGFKRYESAVAGSGSSPAVAARPVSAEPATPPSGEAATASRGGAGFANGYQVFIDLQLKSLRKRAYCAVWVENEKGEYVRTLAIWGNERKYLASVDAWWKWRRRTRN